RVERRIDLRQPASDLLQATIDLWSSSWQVRSLAFNGPQAQPQLGQQRVSGATDRVKSADNAGQGPRNNAEEQQNRKCRLYNRQSVHVRVLRISSLRRDKRGSRDTILRAVRSPWN